MTTKRPLAAVLRDMIQAEGPIGLDAYMAAALGHPVHGYYMTRDPLGAAGDFTTAPEISQMFGEMLGLWAAHVWTTMGCPAPVLLVELGPGRGTLMADALRAAAALPAFRAAAEVHLVESSPALRDKQRAALAGIDVAWHGHIAFVPHGPTIVLANEFLDALPIRQYEKRRGRWRERLVSLDRRGNFVLGLDSAPVHPHLVPHFIPHRVVGAAEGAVIETSSAQAVIAAELNARFARHPGAALFLDYGHAVTQTGETFQAVGKHKAADPFAAPGTVDLTAHVDFEAFAAAARRGGADVHGPIGQGAFLNRLGIAVRAERLAAGKSDDQRREIAAALDRLTAAEGMGTLFQALALTSPGLPAPPPFA